MSDIVGIDLGTTNTVVARNGAVLPQPGERHGLPSAVAYPPSGAVLVGSAARRRRPIDPENTIVSSKRLIGRDASSIDLTAFSRRYPVKLALDPVHGPTFLTRAGARTPTEIATTILRHALQGAGVDARHTRAVVAIPAAFAPPQRAATIEAVRAADLKDAQLIEEPIAVAIAHFGTEPRGLCAVYDFGGGTFDIAIVDARKWPFRVVGRGGDLFLGGDDLDAAFARFLGAELIRLHGWDVLGEVTAFDRLVAEAERAKMRLSAHDETHLDLGEVDPDTPIASGTLRVSRAQFVACTMDLVRRTFVSCDAVLQDARVNARDIDDVLLAGGTTLIPSVADAAARYFGRAAHHEVPPMDAVALGAARAPWRTFG